MNELITGCTRNANTHHLQDESNISCRNPSKAPSFSYPKTDTNTPYVILTDFRNFFFLLSAQLDAIEKKSQCPLMNYSFYDVFNSCFVTYV